jgi:hypothetical protein
MFHYDVLIKIIPEIENVLDENRWNKFNTMRQEKISLLNIARELRISIIQAMALEDARKCIIKWNGDTENLRKCLRGEIDP